MIRSDYARASSQGPRSSIDAYNYEGKKHLLPAFVSLETEEAGSGLSAALEGTLGPDSKCIALKPAQKSQTRGVARVLFTFTMSSSYPLN